jgi:hypothetical protein
MNSVQQKLNTESKGDKYFVEEVETQLIKKPLWGSQTQDIHCSENKASYKAVVALTYLRCWCKPRSWTYYSYTWEWSLSCTKDPLSLPSGPITRHRAKRFKEALNGLIQENWADSKKTKMGSNNNQGLIHVIKAIEEDN